MCYKLHKSILAKQSVYFCNLLSLDTNHIQLPDTFSWDTIQLQHFMDLLYNKYDNKLYEMKYSTNINKLLFEPNYIVTADDGWRKSYVGWKREPHYGETVQFRSPAGRTQELKVTTPRFPLHFINNQNHIVTFDLGKQLELVSYFDAQTLFDLIQSVLMNYIRDGEASISVSLLAVADKYNFTAIRTACIAYLSKHIDGLTDMQSVSADIKSQSMLEIMKAYVHKR